MDVRCQCCGKRQSRGLIPDERSRLKHVIFHGVLLGVCVAITKHLFVRVWHAPETWLNLAAAFGVCILLLGLFYAALMVAEVIVVSRLRCQACGQRQLSSVSPSDVAKSQPLTEIVVGGLYAGHCEEGGYHVVKVLALDEEAVHLRLYADRFQQKPNCVTSAELSLGRLGDPGRFGIGHFPLARGGFGNFAQILLAVEPVAEVELEGYRIWQGTGGT